MHCSFAARFHAELMKVATRMSRSSSIEAGLSVRDMDNAFVISKRYMPITIVLVREEE